MALDKDTKTVLYIGGAILLLPLIKKIIGLGEDVADVLSLPGDLIKKIGDSAVKQVHDAAYNAIANYASYHIYDENDPNDIRDMKRLKEDFNFTSSEINTLVNLWKDRSAKKLGAMVGEMAKYELFKSQVAGFLRRLLP